MVEAVINYWEKPLQRAKHLGFGVRIGPNQLPHLHSMLVSHANVLNVPCPELFVKQDPTLNAYTFGTNDDACVVVHSALVDLLDEQELSFILAHEIGHIKARHVTYGSVLAMFAQGLLGPLARSPLQPETVVALLVAPLDAWSREAEQTADQIGVILAEDPGAAVRALMLLAVGSRALLTQMNIAPYLEQQEDLANFYGKWQLYFGGNDHPYVVTRVLNVFRFLTTEQARSARATLGHGPLLAGPSPRPAPKFRQLDPPKTDHASTLNFCPECGVEISYRASDLCRICGFRYR